MTQPTLFPMGGPYTEAGYACETASGAAKYPDSPGWKRQETSKDAADAIADHAAVLRDRCEAVILERDATADEVAEILGETPFAVRPRMSELFNAGKIAKSGQRRPNQSGHSAIVWTRPGGKAA